MAIKGAVKCVLLADRHSDLTESMSGLIKTTFDAVVTVADVTSLLESARRLEPVVAIVDLSLAQGGCLDLLKRLRLLYPQLRLILLSVYDEPKVARLAIEAGADGFVLKRSLCTDLLQAIDAVLNGKRYVSPGIRDREGLAEED